MSGNSDAWKIIKSALTDWAKVGTMLVVSRMLAGEPLDNADWRASALYTLVGFTAYDLLISQLINTDVFGRFQPIADDWVKVGTMLIVSRLLSGKSLNDPGWLQSSLFTLLGFTAYHLFTKPLFGDPADMCQQKNAQDIAADWMKVGTMLLVSRLLSRKSPADLKWIHSSLWTILGFTAYQLTSAHLINRLP